MEEKAFRIGLLGLGVMGKRHTEACAALPDVEMVTRDSPEFAGVQKQSDHAAYQTALCHAMIADPAIDAIDICLPTGLHAPLTIAALAAGKHVLCEKPMALNVEDCRRMLAARAQSRGILMVAHVLRFWPAYEFLREVVACRAYGSITSASLTRKSGLPTWAPWLLRAEESGGGILDMLVHDFDQALLLFGAPQSVTGHTDGSLNAIDCSLRYPDGFTVQVAGGWHAGEVPFGMGYELVSKAGTLEFKADQLELRRPPDAATPIALKTHDAYTAQLAYFVDCCRKGQEPAICTPQSSASAVALACAVRDLAAAGAIDQPLTLPTWELLQP
jgi:predicted dehydrogenase